MPIFAEVKRQKNSAQIICAAHVSRHAHRTSLPHNVQFGKRKNLTRMSIAPSIVTIEAEYYFAMDRQVSSIQFLPGRLAPLLASPVHVTRGIPVQPSLDIARVCSSRGRSSVKNLTSVENRSYLVRSVRGTKRICFISGEQGLACPEFRPCRNAANPSRGVQRK